MNSVARGYRYEINFFCPDLRVHSRTQVSVLYYAVTQRIPQCARL
jgi:hypothetical protein